MAETYYPYTCLSTGTAIPSGAYTFGGWSVTVSTVVTFLAANSASRKCFLTLTGDASEFDGRTWTNGSQLLFGGTYNGHVIYDIQDGGSTGITGVSGLVATESVHVDGLYTGAGQGSAVTPTKLNYTFDPVSFTWNGGNGEGAYVTFLATGPVIPTLDSPADESTGLYLNKDHLLELRWADTEGVDIDDHTVYFDGVPQTDRSRYSIVAYKIFLDITLEYETTYQWFVRKDLGGGQYVDSETWSFTTMVYAPPAYSTRTRPPYGGGDAITVPTGENSIITIRRLIAVVGNKFFYEDV